MTCNKHALIGYSGFVGSVLLRQTDFAGRFRSTNIGEVGETDWDTVVCAAAPAAKWIANRDPEGDRANIDALIKSLDSVQCRHFILISTVDVFGNPMGVDENTPVEEDGLHAYGLHRRLLEKFVESRFEQPLVVRLPGLVGPGLRKNVVFDFLNDNNLSMIDSRGVFQFYPMVNLWYDLQIAMDSSLKLVHFTAEPVSVAEVARKGFNMPFGNELSGVPAQYDLRSIHAELFGGRGAYQYSRRESVQAIRAYAQAEPGRAES
jgi:hypothetical protein